MKSRLATFLCDKVKLLTVLVALPAIASIFAEFHYLLELTSHFRAHYAGVFAILLVFLLSLRQWRWCAFAGIGFVGNAIPVVAWHVPAAQPAPANAAPLRLLLSNVYTANTDTNALLEFIRAEKPDIIVLQEINDRWLAALKVLDAEYPASKAEPRDDNFGIGVWSRIPFSKIAIFSSGLFDVPSITAEIAVAGQPLTLIATHPVPPASEEGAAARNSHLEEIAKIAARAEAPAILIGDLNVTMWSPYYSRFERDSGLKNVRKGFGVLPSWPTPFTIVGIPLDHCLVHPSLQVRAIRLGSSVGSDHLPLIVDLAIPGGR